MSDDTQKVDEQKGRLLALIEKLNCAGARAFHGDAVTKAKFNKGFRDVLLAMPKLGEDADLEREPSR